MRPRARRALIGFTAWLYVLGALFLLTPGAVEPRTPAAGGNHPGVTAQSLRYEIGDRMLQRASRGSARGGIIASTAPGNRAVREKPRRSPAPVLTHEAKWTRGFSAWRASHAAHAVLECESHTNYRAVSSTGKYRGAWQMDASFWRSYGGLKYASRPELASPHEQDLVAYAGYLARGWQPWSCRRAI